jgi:hypothetical protein
VNENTPGSNKHILGNMDIGTRASDDRLQVANPLPFMFISTLLPHSGKVTS